MPVTHPKRSASLCLTASLLLGMGSFCSAQSDQFQAATTSETSTSLPDAPDPHNTPSPTPTNPSKPEPITLSGTPKRILFDQKAIWTSPLHIKPLDATWLLPLSAVTGTLIGSDHH